MVSRKSRKDRKNRSRKDRKNRSRKDRKDRKNRSRKNRNMMGGMAPVNDTSMSMAQRDSLAQGSQYLSIHKHQHGGSAAPYPTAVTNSVLSGPMIAATRTGPLDTAISQIQGMQDGGRRRKSSRKSRKHKRSHRGGSHSVAAGSPVSASAMLLPAGMDKQAALNYEWSMAKDPNAFAPKQ